MNNQLQFFEVDNTSPQKPLYKSKYQKWKMKNCCCYENGKCLWTKRYYENNIVPDCEKVKDCYYKQLQRAKEALEEIREIANAIVYGTHFTDNIEGHFKELNKRIIEYADNALNEVNNGITRIFNGRSSFFRRNRNA